MAPRSWSWPAAALASLVLAGCLYNPGSTPPDTSGLVYVDSYQPGVGFQPFLGSKQDAVSEDTAERHAGSSSLRVTVPALGDPTGGSLDFAGGAFTAGAPRDLTGYNALTFWTRASKRASLDTVGFGNDNSGFSPFTVRTGGLPLTTTWTRQVLPIPVPSKLTSERGLLWFAEGADGSPPEGYRFWLDDVRFERVDDSTWNPRPSLRPRTIDLEQGDGFQIQDDDAQVIYTLNGVDRTFTVAARYLDFGSSSASVATVDSDGKGLTLGPGTATITASLGGLPAANALTVRVTAVPTTPPPTPTAAPQDVISLFSDHYPNGAVDNFLAFGNQLPSGALEVAVADFQIGTDVAKKYTKLGFAGMTFRVDATAMTTFHLDVWSPSFTVFKVKLVDFGADGAFGGGDDSSDELTFNASSSPPLSNASWVSLDIPLSRFALLRNRAHLSQLIISGPAPVFTAYVDNIYFHR